MTVGILYTTFADVETAKAFADRVLAAELAACVNLVPGARSLYRWQGELQDAAEVLALIKTRRELRDALFAFARRHHPYETPALLWFEPAAVDEGFAAWIMDVTSGAPRTD